MTRYTKSIVVLAYGSLIACSTQDASPVAPPSQEATSKVQIEIDWDAIQRSGKTSGAALSALLAHDPYPINRVGVRVEYPKEDAVFMQTVDRATASQSGVITMTLPPTSEARIFVLAVHESVGQNDRDVAKAMAFLNLGRLIPGKAAMLTTSALNFVDASWRITPPAIVEMRDGRMEVEMESAATNNVWLPYEVVDPFGDVQTRTSTRSFVELNGSGGSVGTSPGVRYGEQYVGRNGAPAGTTTTAGFYPYINGALFNLGGIARFAVLPEAFVRVTWRD